MGDVALSRPGSSREPRRGGLRRISQFRCSLSHHRLREWALDERRWFHGDAQDSQSVLVLRFSLYRLPSVGFPGYDRQRVCKRTYTCGADCQCSYQTKLADQCKTDGKGVLAVYEYATGKTGEWVGILLSIVAGYRLLGWLILTLRKR